MILSKVKNTFNKYRGLSTEEKPTNIPQHSSFLETDTGATYNYDGLQWNLEESGGSGGGSSGGGALYLTGTRENDAIVLSASYNDILAAIADNKVIFYAESVANGFGYHPLMSIGSISAMNMYLVTFANYDEPSEVIRFTATSATDHLVLQDDVSD